MVIKAGWAAVRFPNMAEIGNCTFTHGDYVMNIPHWADRNWIHISGIQGEWDSIFMDFQGANSHDMTFTNNRFVRGTDCITISTNLANPPRDYLIKNNHLIGWKDDCCAHPDNAYDWEVSYNYIHDGSIGFGIYESGNNPIPTNKRGTMYFHHNVFDLRKPWLANGKGLD